jgi:uncharacterized membrane protein
MSTTVAQIPHDCEGRSTRPPSTSSSRRLVGVDVARGVALLGMMVVHLLPPTTAEGDPSAIWMVFVGKSAALFAVVAGVGIAFSTGRTRVPPAGEWAAAATSLLVRAVLIGALGLALGMIVPVDTAHVILPYYAVLFLLAIPLLRLPVRQLLVLAAVAAVAFPVLSHLVRAELPPHELANPTFADLTAAPEVARDLALTGAYPALPWLTYVLVGLALGRSRLSRAAVVAMTGAGLVVASVAWVVSWALLEQAGGRSSLLESARPPLPRPEVRDLLVYGGDGVAPATNPWWLATAAPHTATPLDLLLTTGLAVAVLGLCIATGWVAPRLLRPLAAAGSMPLTLYAAHLLLLATPAMPGGGGGLLLQAAVLVAGALLWRKRFDRGPLEQGVWLVTRYVRRVTSAPPGRSRARVS